MNTKEYFIYMIVNPNGNVYIGQSCHPESRILAYKYNVSKKQVKIYNSIKKHGFNNHIIKIFPKKYTKEK